jgi:multicomponent Na+:H+ antiporter subunit G
MIDILVASGVIFLCVLGLLFYTGGTIGILRLPDVYTRLHMAGKLDTLGSLSLLLGLILYGGYTGAMSVLVQLKILLLWAFVLVTSPTATHAIVNAGIRAGIEPWIKKKHNGEPS